MKFEYNISIYAYLYSIHLINFLCNYAYSNFKMFKTGFLKVLLYLKLNLLTFTNSAFKFL